MVVYIQKRLNIFCIYQAEREPRGEVGVYGEPATVSDMPYQPPPPTCNFWLRPWCLGSKKTRIMGATGPRKMFDDIFSRLDTMHERDGQTDGRTPDDSKDRAITHSVAR